MKYIQEAIAYKHKYMGMIRGHDVPVAVKSLALRRWYITVLAR
jgi:hypothetical protein